MQNFADSLKDGNCFLISGSIGSLLYERGVFLNKSFDEINISHPHLVSTIYCEFVAAGVHILATNTWGANSYKLKPFALEEKMAEINLQGVLLAKKACASGCYIAGVMGPLGVRIEPWGPTSFQEARSAFCEQAKALLNAGVDLFILEGFADLNEIQQAILAIKDICDLCIVATMSIHEEGQNLYGTPAHWFIQKLDSWGAHCVGIDGGNGPIRMLDLLPALQSATPKPIALTPNAGEPRLVDGRYIYVTSPEYMGEFARTALKKGARILGGGSGITPQHIKTMAAQFRQARASISLYNKNENINLDGTRSTENQKEKQVPCKSLWAQKIRNREFATSLELLPPKGLEYEAVLERAQICKNHGIDAINIPDGPRASSRMSPLATACLIEREVQIETVLHFTCRDRNLLGMQSDLLGASALGIQNLLCVTGDPPKMGPYPQATAVFDIDAIGLVNMVTRLNSGLDLGGSSIGKSTEFSLGVGANPVACNMDLEKSRFRYKVEAGAQWAITQPVFEVDSLFRFLDFSSQFPIVIIAGIWPLKSYRNAEFMANEVPGVFVPKNILERMKHRTTADDQMKEGLCIAKELIEKIKSSIGGLQISAPFGNVNFALQLLE